MFLGPYPLVSLAEARERAALLASTSGLDPAEMAKAKKTAPAETGDGRDKVQAVIADFMKRHAVHNRRGDDVSAMFRREILPKWGERSIHEITKRDLVDLLDAIVDRGSPITANRLLAHVRTVWTWAVGRDIIAEATATVQACVSLWENAFAMADVEGTDLLNRADMALIGRGLALRGDVVFYIGDAGLIPATDWDVSTRYGKPRAYRLSLADAGGGVSQTALAAEVLHFRIGRDAVTPWRGTSPLRRSALPAGLLNTIEAALAEVYDFAPIGSQVMAFPESPDIDMEALGRGFRGRRGRVLLRESVSVTAAGGPAPQSDWNPKDMTPDLSRAMMDQALSAARTAICAAYGVLPALFNDQAQGPLVREAQRHLAGWTLQPIVELMAEEASDKLGVEVKIDTIRPLQAHDASGRARALQTIVQTLQIAKDAGIPSDQMVATIKAVNFAGGDDLA